MNCKQIQNLLANSTISGYDENIKRNIHTHLKSCGNCTDFLDSIQLIRNGLQKLETANPPAALLNRTKNICYQVLENSEKSISTHNEIQTRISAPNFILVTIAVIFSLMLFWSFPVVKEFILEKTLSKQILWVATIMIQNLIMLFFAPVILNRLGWIPER